MIKNWHPQEGAQERFFEYIKSPLVNILGYGGPRGTGKTEIGINGVITLMLELGIGFNGLYVRNTASGLKPVLRRFQQALIREGLKRDKDFTCNKSEMTIELINGALLKFYYVEGEGLLNLQGENYSHIICEEPQQFKDMETIFGSLKAMWRTANSDVTKKMIFLFNPLGPSNKWLKKFFVDNGSDKVFKEEDSLKKVFVRATVQDNKLLDPSYYKSLENLPPIYRKAWLEGDFNILSGLAFDNLTFESSGFEDKSFRAYDYPYYISYDWGFTDASVFGFYALITNLNSRKVLIKFKELVYKGIGAKEQAVLLKKELKALDNGENLKGCVADTQIFSKSGHDGVSIASFFKEHKIYFQAAKKNRLSGFQHLYSAINEKKLLITKNCKYFWETVPNLILSDKYDGDIEKNPKQEDHAYDETRYMIMHLAKQLDVKIPGGDFGYN